MTPVSCSGRSTMCCTPSAVDFLCDPQHRRRRPPGRSDRLADDEKRVARHLGHPETLPRPQNDDPPTPHFVPFHGHFRQSRARHRQTPRHDSQDAQTSTRNFARGGAEWGGGGRRVCVCTQAATSWETPLYCFPRPAASSATSTADLLRPRQDRARRPPGCPNRPAVDEKHIARRRGRPTTLPKVPKAPNRRSADLAFRAFSTNARFRRRRGPGSRRSPPRAVPVSWRSVGARAAAAGAHFARGNRAQMGCCPDPRTARASDEDGLARGGAKQTGSKMQLARRNPPLRRRKRDPECARSSIAIDVPGTLRCGRRFARGRTFLLIAFRWFSSPRARGVDGPGNAVRMGTSVERDAQIRACGRSCAGRKALSNAENELDESMSARYVGFMLDGGSLLILLVSFVGASRRLWWVLGGCRC